MNNKISNVNSNNIETNNNFDEIKEFFEDYIDYSSEYEKILNT